MKQQVTRLLYHWVESDSCRYHVFEMSRKNYAATEDKLLTVAWLLEETKHFTKSCKDLVVVTDHKLLVGMGYKMSFFQILAVISLNESFLHIYKQEKKI